MSDIQKQVQDTVDQLVDEGAETGLQVAVYRNGEQVVDVVAGAADKETGRPVESGTPFYGTSTGKGITSTVAHVLVERGVFDYDTRISELWPEFGANGKESATLRHALTHTTGVPGVPVETTPEDLCDWQKMTDAIAAAKPWWQPGEKMGYHAQTYGYIIGEVIRRATGKTISQVLKEEVAGPIGMADELFFSVPKPDLGRLATLYEREMSWPQDGGEAQGGDMPDMADMPFFRVIDGYTAGPPAAMPDAAFGNRTDVLTAEIPAGATMSARGVARMYAAVIGEVDGVRLISQERMAEVTKVAFAGDDEIFGYPARRALGYDLGMPMGDPDGPTLIGWAGSTGTAAYAQPELGVAVAVNKNLVSYGDFGVFGQIVSILAKEWT